MKYSVKITIIIFVFLLGNVTLFAQATPEMEMEGKLRADSLNCELVGGWFRGPCAATFIDSTKDTLVFMETVVTLEY